MGGGKALADGDRSIGRARLGEDRGCRASRAREEDVRAGAWCARAWWSVLGGVRVRGEAVD